MKKIVIVIFSFVVCFLSITKVYAYNVVKVNSDYYYTRYNSDGTQFSDKAVSYYINNNPVYCIEPGKKLGNTYSLDNNYNMTSENKIRILLAAHYGYLYGNNIDHRYSLATQSIIWKELTGSYPVYSTKLFGEGEILDLTFYIKDIENKINEHSKKLNLVTEQDLHIGNIINFEDKSKALINYTSTDVSINSNNTFSITFDKVGKKTIFFNKKKEYNENYKIFTDGENQSLLMAGNIPELNQSIELDIKPVKLTVFVKDSENKEIINECSVNVDGNSIPCNSTYTFNDTSNHKYYLESVPDNYVLDDKEYTFSNYFNSEIVKNFYIDPIYNNYTIYKTYDNEFPEENAIFELNDDKGNIIKTYTTDKDGKFDLHLKIGDYLLVQTKGKDGYTLVETVIHSNHDYKKSPINLIHLNDEKILNNDSEVDIIKNHPTDEKSDTISKSLVSTGDELSLNCLIIVLSLLCLLTKKVIAI